MSPNPPNILQTLGEILQEERQPKASKEFHHNPSSSSFKKEDGTVVGACLRQLYYKATGQQDSDPKDLTQELTGVFGQAIHDTVLTKLQKAKNISIVPEVAGKCLIDPLTSEVSYRIDGLVTHKDELGFLELKTIISHSLRRIVQSNEPKDSDVLQCLSYFGANPSLVWCCLVYLARDSGSRAEFHIYKDAGFFYLKTVYPVQDDIPSRLEYTTDGIFRRWRELEGFIARKELPPRDYKVVFTGDGRITKSRIKNHIEYKSDMRCLYCPYLTHCWTQEANALEDSRKLA